MIQCSAVPQIKLYFLIQKDFLFIKMQQFTYHRLFVLKMLKIILKYNTYKMGALVKNL